MKIKHAVICAAGFGSRLGLNTPKCLVQIGQHKLIYYLLNLLKDVEDIRIVVGYKEEEVIEYVRQLRNDVTFVRNNIYATTSNSYSLYLGSKDLKDPYLMIDGDLIIEKTSFNAFVESCVKNKTDVLGVTRAKTDDAVFVKFDSEHKINEFSRKKISDFEWSGLAYFDKIKINDNQNYVYQQVEGYLPVLAKEIICWEIDTPNDLSLALNELNLEGL